MHKSACFVFLGVLSFVATGVVAACKSDDDCDPGFSKQNNICVPQSSDASEAGNAAPDAAEADAGAADAAPEDAGPFGRPCTHGGADSGDCEPPASYCAIQPGTTTGYCTAIDCKANPSVCPAHWTCFSVPGIDFCFKP